MCFVFISASVNSFLETKNPDDNINTTFTIALPLLKKSGKTDSDKKKKRFLYKSYQLDQLLKFLFQYK